MFYPAVVAAEGRARLQFAPRHPILSVKAPVMLVHGDSDEVVPIRDHGSHHSHQAHDSPATCGSSRNRSRAAMRFPG